MHRKNGNGIMPTTSTLKQKIDSLWNKFWSGGISNSTASVGRFCESSSQNSRNRVSTYISCLPAMKTAGGPIGANCRERKCSNMCAIKSLTSCAISAGKQDPLRSTYRMPTLSFPKPRSCRKPLKLSSTSTSPSRISTSRATSTSTCWDN